MTNHSGVRICYMLHCHTLVMRAMCRPGVRCVPPSSGDGHETRDNWARLISIRETRNMQLGLQRAGGDTNKSHVRGNLNKNKVLHFRWYITLHAFIFFLVSFYRGQQLHHVRHQQSAGELCDLVGLGSGVLLYLYGCDCVHLIIIFARVLSGNYGS